jgi:hypothetical protein
MMLRSGSARVRLAGVGLAGLAAVAALGLTASSQATSPPSVGRCAASALRVVSFRGQGAAGTEYAPLRFELRRGGPCTLTGYPGVTLLDGHHQFDVNVPRAPAFPVRTLRLDAHHPAYFNLIYHAFVPATGRPCQAKLTDVKVIPPNDRQKLSATLRPSLPYVCVGSVSVGPVEPSPLA